MEVSRISIGDAAVELAKILAGSVPGNFHERCMRMIALREAIGSARAVTLIDRLIQRAIEVDGGKACDVAAELAAGNAVDLAAWQVSVQRQCSELRALEAKAGTTLKALGLEVYDPHSAADAMESLRVALPIEIELEELQPN